MMDTISLSQLREGQTLFVLSVDGRDDIKQRFFDLGIEYGTEMTCVMIGPLGGIKAYRVRGAIIAIRDEDADGIVGETLSMTSREARV